MKKTIISTITLIILTCLLFVGCAPAISPDKYDLTGSYGAGVSGTPAVTFAPLTQNSDNPLSREDVIVERGEIVWREEYYTTTISLAENADDKMVARKETITYIKAFTDEKNRPSNWADFFYISTAMPKEIYEVDYLYNLERKSPVGAPSNGTTPFDFVVEGKDWIHEKLFAFIRYTYLQTGGKVNLCFTYDTSFNYQTDEFGGGIVIRCLLTVNDCQLTQNTTLTDLLNASVGGDTLIGIFNHTGNRLGIKPITDIDLASGASTWCDVQIGVPNISISANDLWDYMLYYYNQI